MQLMRKIACARTSLICTPYARAFSVPQSSYFSVFRDFVANSNILPFLLMCDTGETRLTGWLIMTKLLIMDDIDASHDATSLKLKPDDVPAFFFVEISFRRFSKRF